MKMLCVLIALILYAFLNLSTLVDRTRKRHGALDGEFVAILYYLQNLFSNELLSSIPPK